MDDDDDLPLFDLKEEIFLKICNSFNCRDFDSFKARVPTKLCGQWKSQNCSPQDLLNEFRCRGVTVKQLAIILDELQLEQPMSYIVDDIPVYLVQNLPKEMVVEKGQSLSLQCKAKGFCYPKYCWFRCPVGKKEMMEIDGQISEVLHIDKIQESDAGCYSCTAYNFDRKGNKFTISTGTTKVTVLIDSNDTTQDDGGSNEIEIIVQPKVSGEVEIGTNVVLEVKAKGKGCLKYQWLRDGKPIDEKSNRLEILRIQPVNFKRHWTYQCQISNEYTFVLSDTAEVILSPGTQYTAEDKVALLIGNSDYDWLHPLKSAMEDVVTLASKLTQLDFKVIALWDLNLDEMNNAIKLFCSMLDIGVYGVFYYAGHGFEFQNQRYMLPVNANNGNSLRDSVCAEYVQLEMQKKVPAVAALFLDMCRTDSNASEYHLNKEEFVNFKPTPHPNCVVAFSTTAGSKAYELKGQKNGIFVNHLQNFITQPIPLKEMVDRVLVAVNRDFLAGHLQRPSTYFNLCENRCLRDLIEVNPERASLSIARKEIYKSITALPRGRVTILSPVGNNPQVAVSIEFNPHREFLLNGLIIVVYIESNNLNILPYLKMNDDRPKEFIQMKPSTFVFPVYCLQKLKEAILAKINFINKDNGEHYDEICVNLESPLIMSAKLWEIKRGSPNAVEEDSWVEPHPMIE